MRTSGTGMKEQFGFEVSEPLGFSNTMCWL